MREIFAWAKVLLVFCGENIQNPRNFSEYWGESSVTLTSHLQLQGSFHGFSPDFTTFPDAVGTSLRTSERESGINPLIYHIQRELGSSRAWLCRWQASSVSGIEYRMSPEQGIPAFLKSSTRSCPFPLNMPEASLEWEVNNQWTKWAAWVLTNWCACATLVTANKQTETNSNTVTGMQVGGCEWRGLPPLLQGLKFNLAIWFQSPYSYHNPNLQQLVEEFCVVLYSLWFLIFLFEFQGNKRSLQIQKKGKLIWYV